MPLSNQQIKAFRARGHKLKPIVTIAGAGLTEGVNNELELSINHHELMKIKVLAEDRETRSKLIDLICSNLGAELIQRIGNMALIYRLKND
ncbi:MAG: YhbY family RNA-binding protein [Gammaproteobacteria bacterium]|nr:YhbY family RNA-binding protein [Gammaproteobacteria bacterium]